MQRINDETRFKVKVLNDLKKLGGFVFKTQERTLKGVPDIIGCFNGKFIAIELKVDGEEVTAIQGYRLKQINDAGGMAFETTPSQWADHLLSLKHYLERF